PHACYPALLPYTTLFRSRPRALAAEAHVLEGRRAAGVVPGERAGARLLLRDRLRALPARLPPPAAARHGADRGRGGPAPGGLHGACHARRDDLRHEGARRLRAAHRAGHAAGVGAGAPSMRPAAAALVLLALAAPACAERQADRVIVRGDGFAFGVKEPPAWRADLSHPSRFGAP